MIRKSTIGLIGLLFTAPPLCAEEPRRNPVRPDSWRWSMFRDLDQRPPLAGVPGVPGVPETETFVRPERVVSPGLNPIAAPTAARLLQLKRPAIGLRCSEAFTKPPPSFLRDAVVLTPPGPNIMHAEGQAFCEFEVLADGPIVVAVYWNAGAPRPADIVVASPRQLHREGWTLVGQGRIYENIATGPGPRLLFYRNCKTGDKFKLRTDQSFPPVVIVPRVDQIPNLAAWGPEADLSDALQRKIVAAKLLRLLSDRRFDELEQFVQVYVTSESRLPSGEEKLSALAAALGYSKIDGPTREEVRQYLQLLESWLAKHPNSAAAKLTLAALYSESVETAGEAQLEPSEVDRTRRRALELAYEAEQAGLATPLLYRTLLRMGYWEQWDEELVDGYVEKVLDKQLWAPAALAAAYLQYSRKYREQSEKAALERIQAFAKQVLEASRAQYGQALWTAMAVEIHFRPSDAAFYSAGFEWESLRKGFDELRTRFPGSRTYRQHYCRWACLAGDRETAARLFEEIGESGYDAEDNIWDGLADFKMRKHWASPDLLVGDQELLFDHPPSAPVFVAWLTNRTLVYCDAEGVLWFLDVPGDKRQRWGRASAANPYAHQGAFDFHASARRLTIGTQGGDLSTAMIPEHHRFWYTTENRAMVAVALSPDEKYAVGSGFDGGELMVFDMRTEGAPRHVPTGYKAYEALLRFVDDRRVLSVGFDGVARVRSFPELAEQRSWKVSDRFIMYAALSRDVRRLATCGDSGAIVIWDVSEGRQTARIPGGAEQFSCFTFSNDGRFLAVGRSGSFGSPPTVVVFDAEQGGELARFHGHRGAIVGVALSPDNTQLASVGRDHSIRIWKLALPDAKGPFASEIPPGLPNAP